MTVKVSIEGLRGVERNLAKLKRASARALVTRIARQALEPMADHAAALAPVDRGPLSFSIAVSPKRTRRARSGSTSVRFVQGAGFRADAKTDVSVAMGPAGGFGALYYATHVEFGTVDTPAQPFMRPAWETGKMRALNYVVRELKVSVDKAVARMERRKAKAG